MKKIIALLAVVLFCKLAVGQQTHFGHGYDNLPMTSLAVATNLHDACLIIDKSILLVEQEKEFSYGMVSDFAKSDTILELVRVDCNSCEEYDKYMINMNADLSIEYIKKIIAYTKKRVDNKSYKQLTYYNETLYELKSILEKRREQQNITNEQIKECKILIEEMWVLLTETGEFRSWLFGYMPQNYITDALYAEIRHQLKHPLYPKQYAKDYMEDNKDKWDSALVDTSLLNRDYMKLWRNRTINEQEFRRNFNIDIAFERYNKIANAHGITPQQALYNEVLHGFWMQGYKDFGPMIDYAVKNNDQNLLPALKVFYKKNPNFKFTEQQKAYFEKNLH